MSAPRPPASGDLFARHPRPLVVGGVSLSLLGLAVPALSIPAFLWGAITSLALRPPLRRWAVLGLLISSVGFFRFMARDGAPAILLAGQRSAEEKAVSRLRELAWAQSKARELALVAGPEHRGLHLTLPELLGLDARRGVRGDAPLLRPGTYAEHTPEATQRAIYRADGYLFAVHLPETSEAAARQFVAYAWPLGEPLSGSRLFYIDESDRICESDLTPGQGGVDGAPDVFAAFAAPDWQAARCPADGPRRWRPWRGKQPGAAPQR